MTGAAATAAGLLLLVASPLYVLSGKPPPLHETARFADYVVTSSSLGMTTKLVDAVYIAGFVVFVSGFRQLLRNALPGDAWISDLVFGAGLVHASVVLVGDVLAGGAALDAATNPDPATVRALTAASLVAFGPIGFMMTALLLAGASGALFAARTGRLIAWAGVVLAVLNLAAIPAVYRGSDFMETVIVAGGNTAAGPYSYISSLAGLLHSIWLVVLGVAVLRNRLLPARIGSLDRG